MQEPKAKLLAKRVITPTSQGKKFVAFNICDPLLQTIEKKAQLGAQVFRVHTGS